MRRIQAALFLSCLALGCGSGSREVDTPDQAEALHALLGSDSAARLVIGAENPKRLEEAFARVQRARANEGGTIAILDLAYPLVRIFNSSGGFLGALVPRGSGPGEARSAYQVALSDEGAVLVYHDAIRFTLFSSSGEVLATTHLPEIRPLAIAPGCSGDWVLYGPEAESAREARAWVHRLWLEHGELLIEPILSLEDTYPATAARGGSPYGLVRSPEAVLLHHEFRTSPTLIEFPCSGWPRKTRSTSLDPTWTTAADARLVGDAQPVLRAGELARAGMVVAGDALLIARTMIMDIESATFRTYFNYLGRDTTFVRYVQGSWYLQDYREGLGILVTSPEDTIPRVRVFSPQVFLTALKR